MPLLDMITINEEAKNIDGVMKIVEKALDYFPEGIWEGTGPGSKGAGN